MKILVLGGTKFLGRHLVQLALDAGCSVTLFNRGRQAPELFSQNSNSVQKLIGDRSSDLTALQKGNWDVVYDLSGYKPEEVRATAALIGPRVERYIFISTVSVYLPGTTGSVDENCAVYNEGLGYGHLKALCEQEVFALPGNNRGIVVRPGLIVGPFDPTYRFNYWLNRVARGGAVLAPGKPGRSIQVIDARDLAAFLLRLGDLQLSVPGPDRIFNATGLAGSLSMQDLLQTIEAVGTEMRGSASSQPLDRIAARFCWVDDHELVRRSIAEWTELPLWIAEDGESANFYAIDSSKAVGLGLRYRPIAETVRAIYQQHPRLLAAEIDSETDPKTDAKTDSATSPTLSPSLEAAILADTAGGL